MQKPPPIYPKFVTLILHVAGGDHMRYNRQRCKTFRGPIKLDSKHKLFTALTRQLLREVDEEIEEENSRRS